MPEPRNCPAAGSHVFKEAVCIDANRIYDSCSDKDCLEDLRVFFTDCDQPKIDAAMTIKVKDVEVISVYLDVEPVPFNKGFYSVDMTFFFAVRVAVYCSPVGDPCMVTGVCSFSKKCILFGSEGCVKTFTSDDPVNMAQNADCNPKAVVQCVDPIVLSSCVVEACDCSCNDEVCGLPTVVAGRFNGAFGNTDPTKIVLVTLGLFTIIQLERDVQMMIPAYDFAKPDKECSCSSDDPCEVFRKIKFPTDEFFPPKMTDFERCD